MKILTELMGIGKRDRVIVEMINYIAKLEKENRKLKAKIVELANK